VALREQTLAKGGLMPGRDLGSTFSSLRPNDLVWNYVQSNYLKGNEPPAFDLLYWNGDSTGLPGPMFCWYLRNTYLENSLKTGQADGGRRAGRPEQHRRARLHLRFARRPYRALGAAYASMAVLNPKKEGQPLRAGRLGPHRRRDQSPVEEKRSYWSNDAGKAPARRKPSRRRAMDGRRDRARGQLVAGMGGLPGRTRRRRRESARQAGQQATRPSRRRRAGMLKSGQTRPQSDPPGKTGVIRSCQNLLLVALQ
jgi:hypothetical protein